MAYEARIKGGGIRLGFGVAVSGVTALREPCGCPGERGPLAHTSLPVWPTSAPEVGRARRPRSQARQIPLATPNPAIPAAPCASIGSRRHP